jgi:hypothetical protein
VTEPDPIAAALAAARAFEGAGVAYLIGGSVASTLHGEPRATADVDFAVHLEPADVERLAAALEPDFHVDTGSIRAAVQHASSFNAIDRRTYVKVDVFVRPRSGLHGEEIERAKSAELRAGPDGRARVATAEDTLLQKLRWYRSTGETSDRQWRDVLGIVRVNGPDLDRGYLARWAGALDLEELLERALQRGGLGG